MAATRPSFGVRIIRWLPFGRRLILRVYNRFFMHFYPRRQVTTVYGPRIMCDVRDSLQATIANFGVWEPNLSRVLCRIIEPGDTVIDIGANIGYYSMLFSSLVGENGKVVAIEPIPNLISMIAENAEINSFSNIRIVNAAVTAEAGQVTLYGPSSNIGLTTIRPDRGFPAKMVVDAMPLHRLLTEDEVSQASVIKIDIEGAEGPVVAQILETLDSYSPRISIAVEACPIDNPTWTMFFEKFQTLGFIAYEIPNYYDWMKLLDADFDAPKRLDTMPSTQADLLFTRVDLSSRL